MPKAYSYIRFSKLAQAQGDSYRRQLQETANYCQEHGLELDNQVFLDAGVSAYNLSNLKKSLGRFIQLVQRGSIPADSVLILESLDRLSRADLDEAMGLFSDILATGVDIITLFDRRRYSKKLSLIDYITSSITLSRANEESKQKSMRLSSAWKHKRSNAHLKKLTHRCPSWLTLKRNTFVVNQERVAIIKRVFDMYIAGQGFHLIAKTLNQEQVKGFNVPFWNPTTVHSIITSRQVIGEYQPCKVINKKQIPDGDVVKDYFPTVIDKDIFYHAQSLRKSRKTKGGKGALGSTVNIFSGLLFCYSCGNKIYMRDSRKHEKVLYCSGHSKGICDVSVRWSYFETQDALLTYMAGLDLQDLFQDKSKSAKIKSLQGKIDNLEQAENKIIETIECTGGSIQKLADRLINIQESKDTYANKLKDLLNELDEHSRVSLSLLKDANNRLKIRDEIRYLVERIVISRSVIFIYFKNKQQRVIIGDKIHI